MVWSMSAISVAQGAKVATVSIVALIIPYISRGLSEGSMNARKSRKVIDRCLYIFDINRE